MLNDIGCKQPLLGAFGEDCRKELNTFLHCSNSGDHTAHMWELGGVPNWRGCRAMGEESSLPSTKSVAINCAMVSFLRY